MTKTSLAAEEKPVSVDSTPMDWAEFWLRVIVTIVVLVLFVFVNSKVLGLITNFASADIQQIEAKTITAQDRLINDKVILALIAGTVTQVVTVLIGITRYLFPAGSK
jgi:hypothetical protein